MSGGFPLAWASGRGLDWSRLEGGVLPPRVPKVTFLASPSHTVWGRVRSLYYVQTVNESFNFLLQKGEVQFS